jgi:hypothetical protein
MSYSDQSGTQMKLQIITSRYALLMMTGCVVDALLMMTGCVVDALLMMTGGVDDCPQIHFDNLILYI